MESWSYIPEERSYLFSDEMDFSLDAFMMRSKKPFIEFENKSSCNFERVSSFGEEDSDSKHLSSLDESKIRDSSLIDLKLGRLDRDVKESTSTPIHQTALSKKARTSRLPAHAPVCQVYGCNMDLSSSKDYHKRHKVCDVHSKTAKVIVNGVEQRFCQQCSRFHLLAEFDDGKRSCRRRLAGHNERRRKPQFDYMTNKQHKILQSYQGTKYLESSIQNIPHFDFQDIFQSGHIKLEEEPNFSPQLASPATLGHELSSRALSLLSSPSQNPSRRAAENPLTNSLIYRGIRTQDNDDQVSETPLNISSVDKHNQNESFPFSDDICETSESMNIKSEHGVTVDLFQLSSHLQRVEQQRNSVLVKLE